MAIIQISKLQQRSGNLVDLPQLDEGEFGWASDTKRLFIGKTTPNENIEVLTSYSDISFSQINGSGNTELNLANTANGQILGLEVVGPNTFVTNKGGNVGGLIDLGDVGNVKIGGGAIGYILETDSLGNLSWTPKGTLYTEIIALSNATPIIMTVAADTPYINASKITISGVQGASNSIVNSNDFYVKLATNYPTTGNVELYTDFSLSTAAVGTGLTYTNSPNGIATSSLSGSGGTVAGGANTTVQFNSSGLIAGDADFTFNNTGTKLLTINGNISTGNVNLSGTATAPRFISNVATGTEPITVTSTTRVSNLNVSYSNVADYTAIVTQTTGNYYLTFANAITGNVQQTGNATYVANLANGSITATTFIGIFANGTSNVSIPVASGNVNISSAGNANIVVVTGTGAKITGTLSVTGNANVGNLGTGGLVTAVGNITGGNLITGGLVTAVGNITGGNLITGGLVTAVGNITGGNLVTAGLANVGSLSVAGTSNLGAVGNVTITGGSANYLLQTNGSGVLSWVAPSSTSSIANGTSNVSIPVANGNVNTSVGGNANVFVVTGTGANLTGTISASGNASVLGIKTDNYYYANGTPISFAGSYSNSNVAAYLPTYTGNISAGNILLSNAAIVSGNNMTLTTGANTNVGTITGNWSLSAGSKLQATYADLAEYYEADEKYEPGTVLAFGGEKEVTIAEDGTTRVAGVVSTNPAYVMNMKCPGENIVALALQGRVPTKVRGNVRKGDMMVSGGNGYARPSTTPQVGTVIGKALENFDGIEGVIEIAVGRL